MNVKESKSKKAQEEVIYSQQEINQLSNYLDWPGRSETKEDFELIRKAGIQTGWRVLDVGSGTGFLSIPLAREVKPTGCVYCLDSELKLQNIIKQKAEKMKLEDSIKLVQSDVFSMPFPDNYFDAVLSAYMLHELGDLAPKALKEIFRVLKPNHKLTIADFRLIENDQRSIELENWFKQQFKGKEEEVHFQFSCRDLEVMLREAGFHSISISPWLTFQMHGEAVK